MCFFEDFEIFRTLAFLCFSSVSACVHTRQVENQRGSRTGRVQKNHKILRKNTIFKEPPVFDNNSVTKNVRNRWRKKSVDINAARSLVFRQFKKKQRQSCACGITWGTFGEFFFSLLSSYYFPKCNILYYWRLLIMLIKIFETSLFFWCLMWHDI